MQTRFTQPSLLVIDYALARLWMSWGIQPAALIGHSVGEYAAACLAGVFSLEDALTLVAERAALVQSQPGGLMLSVRLPEKDLRPLLNAQTAIAAVNSPHLCVASGTGEAIASLEQLLESRQVMSRRLRTSHAFHSSMMDPVLAPFTARLRRVKLSKPRIPTVSNVTGTWMTAEQAMSPEYWAGHVRQTVRFADGVSALFGAGSRILLEVGPGQTLDQMARQHPATRSDTIILGSLNASRGATSDARAMLEAVGRAWVAGAPVDWRALHSGERRRRIPLPTYVFDRNRFWIQPPAANAAAPASGPSPPRIEDKVTPAPRDAAPGQVLPSSSRQLQIAKQLRRILEELSGVKDPAPDDSTGFLALGSDSLFLVQFSRKLQETFGVTVHFGQLADGLATLDRLARYLDEQRPDGGVTAGAGSTPVPTAAVSNAVIEQLQAQIRLLADQLKLLQSAPALTPGFT